MKHRWDDDVVFKNCARGEEERKVGEWSFYTVIIFIVKYIIGFIKIEFTI